MHTLQPKIVKLNEADSQKFLEKLNVSKSQLPKASKKDVALPENCEIGDILKIERKGESGVQEYFRVVV
jgi:DNA-directed RNA polymerase subunit H (RpoH/RPB5)